MRTEPRNPGNAAPFLAETPRLRLHLLRHSDQAFYCSLYTDPETMRYIGPPLDAARATRSFRAAHAALQRTPPQLVTLVLTDRTTQVRLGIGSLAFCGTQHREAEAGIILHGAARGRGYAREALIVLVERAFTARAVDRIRAQHSVHHSAAERVIGSVGFARESTTGRGGTPMQVWTLDRGC